MLEEISIERIIKRNRPFAINCANGCGAVGSLAGSPRDLGLNLLVPILKVQRPTGRYRLHLDNNNVFKLIDHHASTLMFTLKLI